MFIIWLNILFKHTTSFVFGQYTSIEWQSAKEFLDSPSLWSHDFLPFLFKMKITSIIFSLDIYH